MLSLVTAPAPLRGPVTVAEMKDWARVDGNDDDRLLSELLTAATKAAELYTQRALLTQTWNVTYDQFEAMFRVPLGQLQSIPSITYVDLNGDTQTVTSTIYRVDTTTEPGRITESQNQSWPTADCVTNAVTVQFTAGYGTEADVPQDIKHAIMAGASARYNCREGSYPDAFYDLLSMYRLFNADVGAVA
jgi:uncharacterized phiE125 gp8 family phage protein